jgi:hypothetical protein
MKWAYIRNYGKSKLKLLYDWLTDRQIDSIEHPCGTCDQISLPRSRGYFTTDWRSVCLSIDHPCGTCDQILLPVGVLLSEICGLISVRRPLWREDVSAIYIVITQWSKSRRTRNHTLLYHLRLPQPGGRNCLLSFRFSCNVFTKSLPRNNKGYTYRHHTDGKDLWGTPLRWAQVPRCDIFARKLKSTRWQYMNLQNLIFLGITTNNINNSNNSILFNSFNSLLFMCRVNSYKANYRHSTA